MDSTMAFLLVESLSKSGCKNGGIHCKTALFMGINCLFNYFYLHRSLG